MPHVSSIVYGRSTIVPFNSSPISWSEIVLKIEKEFSGTEHG